MITEQLMNWYVKEFSQLTKVSIRTLHHYDQVNLLKPSVRQSNGYRLYTSADLFKLQQILVLKFFGFSLKQIKILLQDGVNLKNKDTLAILQGQQLVLQKQLTKLQQAKEGIATLITTFEKNLTLPWDNLIKTFGK
jgi:DNA-binding transcriptional MerR regulator